MTLLPSPEFLLVLGPPLLFAMAMAETAIPLGLGVPAGVALSLASFLAMEGLLPWPGVLAAGALGALTGDSLGFWLGRRGSRLASRSSGFTARMVGRYGAVTKRIYGKSPLISVTLARTISFVRTLMPATAGMGNLTYPRFLAYDLCGVALWLALYVGVGVVAGESWKQASGILGTGWALLLVVGGTVAWLTARRHRSARSPMDELLEPLEPLELLDNLDEERA